MPRARPALALLALAAATTAACRATAPASPAGTPAAGDAAERSAVIAVAERMFDAMRTRDTAAMRTLFVPGARLMSVRRTREGQERVQALPWEQFAAAVARDTGAAWNERMQDPEVRVRGTIATLWTRYTFHRGATPSHCGVDAFQLLRTAEGWRIASVADTQETTGCGW